MAFTNQEYIYDHLPARYRRADKDLFLKRYLQFTGQTLDEWDGKFDAFYASMKAKIATRDGRINRAWLRWWAWIYMRAVRQAGDGIWPYLDAAHADAP